jgi:hypothetical protein
MSSNSNILIPGQCTHEIGRGEHVIFDFCQVAIGTRCPIGHWQSLRHGDTGTTAVDCPDTDVPHTDDPDTVRPDSEGQNSDGPDFDGSQLLLNRFLLLKQLTK